MNDRLTPTDPAADKQIIRDGFARPVQTFRRYEVAAALFINQTKLTKTHDIR